MRIIDASNAGLIQLDRPRTPQQYGWLTHGELCVKYPQWEQSQRMIGYLANRGYVGRRPIPASAVRRHSVKSATRWEYNERHYVAYMRGRERFEKLLLKLLADNGHKNVEHVGHVQVQKLGTWDTAAWSA